MVNHLDRILKIVLVFILISIFLYANNQQKGKNKMDNLIVVLEEEIENGVSISCEGGEGEGVEIDIAYYKISSQFFNKKLEERGFKFLGKEEFIQKVSKIFKIDLKKNIHIFDIADISMEYEDEFPSAQSEGGIGLKVFDKMNGLITKIYRLPEIINYQKYEKLNIIEKYSQDNFDQDDCSIYWWKDFYKDINIEERINSEVENILALNNYLFYNKGNIDKLFEDNHYFLTHLVLSNKYYSDLKLLEKVLDDVIDNVPEELVKLLWEYNEEEGLFINKESFKLILKKPVERREKFFKKIEIERNNLYKTSLTREARIQLEKVLKNILN